MYTLLPKMSPEKRKDCSEKDIYWDLPAHYTYLVLKLKLSSKGQTDILKSEQEYAIVILIKIEPTS